MTKFSNTVAKTSLTLALVVCRISVGDAATPAPTPAAPSNLAAAAISPTQINLSWTDNLNNEAGFAVERSINGAPFTQIATVGASIPTYNNTGLSASTTYYYRVRAYNSSGYSAYSSAVVAKTPPSLNAPTVTLKWDLASDPDIVGYRLHYGTSSGAYNEKLDLGDTTTSLVSNLAEGRTYFFAVTAYNRTAESAPSNEVSYKVPASGIATASAAMVNRREPAASDRASTHMAAAKLNPVHDMQARSRAYTGSVEASAYARWCRGEP